MARFFGFVCAVLLLGSATSSQSVSGIWPDPAWCPTCYVASHADSPAAGSTIDGSGLLWLWAGVCASGEIPNAVSAVTVVSGQPVSVPVQFVTGGPRADVTAHLQAQGCNGGHTVIAAWFPNGLPSGVTSVSVRLHSDGMYAYRRFLVAAL
jgi:hypothetical protein